MYTARKFRQGAGVAIRERTRSGVRFRVTRSLDGARKPRDLPAEPALSAFLTGCLLAGALGIVVGWALARAVGLIDGAP